MPPEGAFGRHDSGLFPYIEEDVKKYGDGGWQGGNLSDRYREKGPQIGDVRMETHGTEYCFRQPFNSGPKIEKNNWDVQMRQNRKGKVTKTKDDEEVESVEDDVDCGIMSPRMADSIIARKDPAQGLHERSATGSIAVEPMNSSGQPWTLDKATQF